ncbi:MAG: hypothetical protein ABIO39_14570 [Caulobacteraceae bacterium]
MTSATTHAQTAAEGSATVQSITQCRQIVEEAERFACYDRVAGAIGKGEAAINQAAQPPSVEQRRDVERREFGKPAAPPPIARPAPQRKAEVQKPVDTRVNQIVGKLEHISRMSDGRLLIVTAADGAWVQTDHEQFQNLPRPGAQIMIRRTPIGNFMCDLDRWHPARCRRLEPR